MTSSYANKHIQPNERANKKDGLEEAARTRVAEMNLRPVYHDTLREARTSQEKLFYTLGYT